ncbi:MAG: hypothetical protein LBP72_03145 [Dysgonamonadaceae bacterium]|nr:hypothetical protein [Dysgonamonadaceae bacterium]
MKKNLFLLTSIVLLLWGCSAQDDLSTGTGDENITYPVTIEINDFSLAEFASDWQNLKPDSVYPIHSEEELQRYISPNETSEIDFAEHSLLLVSLSKYNADRKVIQQSLLQVSTNEYQLHLDVLPSLTANAQPLSIALLTPKLSREATFELIVNTSMSDDFPEQNDQWEGYIVGWEGCSGSSINGEYGEAKGYYIVSSDLKDTLLTYNLPSDVFKFSATCFNRGRFFTPVWFEDVFRYAFRGYFEYEIVPEEEKIIPICPAITLIRPEAAHAQQVIIKSVKKID